MRYRFHSRRGSSSSRYSHSQPMRWIKRGARRRTPPANFEAASHANEHRYTRTASVAVHPEFLLGCAQGDKDEVRPGGADGFADGLQLTLVAARIPAADSRCRRRSRRGNIRFSFSAASCAEPGRPPSRNTRSSNSAALPQSCSTRSTPATRPRSFSPSRQRRQHKRERHPPPPGRRSHRPRAGRASDSSSTMCWALGVTTQAGGPPAQHGTRSHPPPRRRNSSPPARVRYERAGSGSRACVQQQTSRIAARSMIEGARHRLPGRRRLEVGIKRQRPRR